MPTSRILIVAIFLAFFISSCGTTSRGRKPVSSVRTTTSTIPAAISVSKKDMSALESGVASWYGPKFHGRLTANGEKYDMDGMTAAHRTLPFNTIVVVENLDNGKTVQVRINDRGPFAKDRIIDLSRSAASQIEMIGPGTANVRVYLIKGDLKNSKVTDLKVANYTVQLGSFADEFSANRLSSQIKGSRVEKATVNNKATYRVYFGMYQEPLEARKALRDLERKGKQGFVKQVENH
ncbi:MAG: septal ring lytic transglycosylase RlpA family protein [Balneolaceae bacterium]